MTHDWRFAGMLALAFGTVGQRGAAQAGATSDTSGYVWSDDGTRLYYHQLGTGAPVIIVPAGLFLERDFAALARGRRVVFYDMRDRGRSDSVSDSTRVTIALDVADLEAVRRHLGAERFVAIGWSYLGQMVMRYAAAHPERVERIVLIGPLARQIGTAYPDSLRALDAEPVPAPSQAAALARARTEGLPMRDPRGDCEMEYQVNRVRLVGDPRLASHVPDVCAMPNEWSIHLQRHNDWLFGTIIRDEPPGWDSFAGLTVPVLLVHGTQDRNVPYGAGREWAAHLPDARLLTIPGAAHMPWIDAPDVVIPAIDGFLRGAWPADASHRQGPS